MDGGQSKMRFGGRSVKRQVLVDKQAKTDEIGLNEKSAPANTGNDESDARSFASAESFIARGAAADSERSQGADGETARQTRLLLEWAAQTGCLISPDRLLALNLVSDRSSEHKIFLDPLSGRAFKQTLPGQFGWMPILNNGRWSLGIANPLDYLRRWILFNRVFDDDVKLEGAGIIGVTMVVGSKTKPVSILISQPWRVAADIHRPLPTEAEIALCLRQQGFELLENSFFGWKRKTDGIVLLDARRDNFIKTKDGVAPIDLPMMQIG